MAATLRHVAQRKKRICVIMYALSFQKVAKTSENSMHWSKERLLGTLEMVSAMCRQQKLLKTATDTRQSVVGMIPDC